MKRSDLHAAMFEAERFLQAARAADKEIDTRLSNGCAATAAANRASMDLTKALANLRHPWRKGGESK
jgi:hypothetical protein